MSSPIAWGAKVSREFLGIAAQCAAVIGVPADWLMACMAFESGCSFRADKRNAAGSGAVGLIQFMPSTAAALGTSTEALAAMTPEQQLVYVQAYFKPWRGKLKTLADVYMVILWPAAVGKPADHVLFDAADAAHPKLYVQNRGLDLDKNGRITKAEASAAVESMLTLGLRPQNAGVLS